jgi:hypothetical protein
MLACAQAVTAPGGAFSDVGQNQYNSSYNYIGPNIQLVLSPELSPHLDLAKFISKMAPQTQTNQEQIQALSAFIGSLLATLDAEYQSGRLLEARTSLALKKLYKYAEMITMQKIAAKPMNLY